MPKDRSKYTKGRLYLSCQGQCIVQDIRRVLGEYGGSVTMIPEEAFYNSNAFHVIAYRDRSGYHVDLDLWIDGDRSDLTLQVEIYVDENHKICGYHILDILVM